MEFYSRNAGSVGQLPCLIVASTHQYSQWKCANKQIRSGRRKADGTIGRVASVQVNELTQTVKCLSTYQDSDLSSLIAELKILRNLPDSIC